jgi:glycosyltransferase involved in cell wall biosynthesis
MVIGESNSLGLPCFATNVGGIPTLVQNGRNGQMFTLSDAPEAWADRIAEAFAKPSNYSALARFSFEEYTTRLNWDTSIERFMQELRSAGLCEN